MITGNVDVKNTIAALRGGAHDFIGKPIQLEELRVTLRNALEIRDLRREVQQSRQMRAERFGFEQIIGESAALKKAVELAKRVAQSDVSAILLNGETGTGKKTFSLVRFITLQTAATRLIWQSTRDAMPSGGRRAEHPANRRGDSRKIRLSDFDDGRRRGSVGDLRAERRKNCRCFNRYAVYGRRGDDSRSAAAQSRLIRFPTRAIFRPSLWLETCRLTARLSGRARA
ncbi:MAG: sigma 54-interacting transcriptional regulator [Pyrinomonadaceae bacterium]